MSQSGGSVTIGGSIIIGNNNDKAVFNLTGGSFTVTAGTMQVAAGGSGSVAVSTVSGGTFTANNGTGGAQVGSNGNGVLNVMNNGQLLLANLGVTLAPNGGTGIVNLDGGTVTTNIVQRTAGTGTINFNGGLLKASAGSGTFMTGLTSAFVRSGGAVIDDGGFAITIGQALLAPTGNGVASISVTGGAGYVDAPVVTLSGGTGTGATAIANIGTNGALIGITVTNPGTGYGTTVPTVALSGGGGTGASIPVATLSANTSGGLTKQQAGAGSLTLSGASTYTGTTNVNVGQLNVTGSLVSPFSVNGGAFLGGTGTISGMTTLVGGASAATRGGINLNNNTVQTLNLSGGLTSGDATNPGVIRFDAGGVGTDTADLITSSTVNLNAGGVLINVTNLGGLLTGHTYTLMSFNNQTGTGAFSVDPASQLGLLTVSLLPSATSLKITIGTVNGANSTPINAFWQGNLGAPWASLAGTATNWRTDAGGATDTNQLPGPITNVNFGTNSETNLTTSLGANFEVLSLTVKALPSRCEHH